VTAAAPFPSLVAYGWTDRVTQLAAGPLAAGRGVGRVVRVSRRVDTVRTPDGEVACSRLSADYRNADLPGPPAVGDWAVVAESADGAAVVGLLPRWSTLSRRDPAGRDAEQVIVANVDLALLTFGLDRPLRAGRLERALVLAHAGGVDPVVVLAKADVGKHRPGARRLLDQLAPDVPRVETSTATGLGIGDLGARVASAGTAVLIGESGSGKSSLVNALVGEDAQAVGDVRAADRKGRHTTTGRELFPLPGGGVVIDTPGLRALGLWDDEGLEAAFPDVEELAERCRFRDCAHRGEPGCAVAEAVSDGRLPAGRLARYLALLDETAALARRREARAWRQADRTPPERRSARRRLRDHAPSPSRPPSKGRPATDDASEAEREKLPDHVERGGDGTIDR
jgi:ribosome biogenesis GTPase